MPTLELVCKRMFADSAWFVKSIVGALLVLIPVVNFFAFGYIYALMEKGRRKEPIVLPDWTDWRTLFVNGLAFFVILVVLGGVPIFAAWLLSLPLAATIGPFAKLPFIPAVVLAAPLTAAGVYRFQRREDFRDAFRVPVLLAMLRAAGAHFLIPTFAFLGFLFVGSPVLPFALFLGGAMIFAYYACFFRYLEDSRRRPAGRA
jgi:hypothetical protein